MKTIRTGMFEFIIAQATLLHTTKPQAKDEPAMPDPRQKALQELFDSNNGEPFGCHTIQAAKLVETMTGLKIAIKKAGHKGILPQFTVAVPISKAALNHGFDMEKPVICLSYNGHCYNGKTNRNDVLLAADTRKPTNEEFNAFIASLTEDAMFTYIQQQLGLSNVL